MANQSKWQRLPTEGINPATRDIDTMPLADVDRADDRGQPVRARRRGA